MSALLSADPELLDDDEYDARLILEYLIALSQPAQPGMVDLGPPGSAKADGSMAADNPNAWLLLEAEPAFKKLGLGPGDAHRLMTGEAQRFDPHQLRDPHSGEWSRGGGTAVLDRPPGTDVAAVSPERFSSAFGAAFAGSPYTAFVNHFTPADIKAEHMKPLMTPDGKAGVLIRDHGDGRVEATSLFNNSGEKGAGLGLLRTAIRDHGVNYVEAFGPALPKLYGTLGFKDAQTFPFDPAEAPPSWDYQRFDNPDYHTMKLSPSKRITRATEPGGLDLEALRAAAAAADPAWWAEYGEEAWAAALVVAGVEPPVSDAQLATQPPEEPPAEP